MSTPSILYTAAQQVADFGSSPSSLTLVIAQRSGLIGPGKALSVTIAVV